MLLFIVVSSKICFIHFVITGNKTVDDVESKDNDENCKNEMKLIDGVENVEEPKQGMTFNSLDELASYYKTYAKQQRFGVVQRNKKSMQVGIHVTLQP
jgi:hypothetical protein